MVIPYQVLFYIISEKLIYELLMLRISVSNEHWETLEGTFTLATIPNHAVLYFEGLNPGIDLLIKSVKISRLNEKMCRVTLYFNYEALL